MRNGAAIGWLRGLLTLTRVVGGLLVLALCGAWASATPGSAAASHVSAASSGWEVAVDQEWGVFSVGPHGRSLEVVFTPNRCGSRNYHATVQETRTTVSVALLREVPTGARPSEELVCTSNFAISRMRVQLTAPLAGRLIVGVPEWRSENGAAPLWAVVGQGKTSTGIVPLAPHLIGFAPADAEGALKLLGLRASIRVVHGGRGLPRVVRQSPAPGATAPLAKPVRLRVLEP
jgi:hypothetical protein